MNTTKEPLTTDQWLELCAARFTKVAGLAHSEAMGEAMEMLEFWEGDTSNDPVESADDEMWTWKD